MSFFQYFIANLVIDFFVIIIAWIMISDSLKKKILFCIICYKTIIRYSDSHVVKFYNCSLPPSADVMTIKGQPQMYISMFYFKCSYYFLVQYITHGYSRFATDE